MLRVTSANKPGDDARAYARQCDELPKPLSSEVIVIALPLHMSNLLALLGFAKAQNGALQAGVHKLKFSSLGLTEFPNTVRKRLTRPAPQACRTETAQDRRL